MKKITLFLACFLVFLGLLVACASEPASEGLDFKLLGDGTYEVIGLGACTDTEIVIPSSYLGKRVAAIGEAAFSNQTEITGVTIPKSVITIGRFAFAGCTALTRVEIPSSVIRIGDNAFKACEKAFETENGVGYIGKWAVWADSSLQTVALRYDTRGIASWVFRDCYELTSVSLPDRIKYVDANAFRLNQSLSTVSYGNCRYIGTPSNPYLVLLGTADEAATSYEIHPKTERIGIYAFQYCHMTSITVPEGVKEIGWSAFDHCENLTSVTLPDSLKTMGYSVFEACTSLETVVIPDSVEEIASGTFSGCEKLSSVTLPQTLKSLGDSTFYGCKSLTAAVIPNGVSKLSYATFRGCERLIDVTLPESVTVIDANTFTECTALSSITLPDGVTEIGASAFSECTALTSVTILDSVSVMGSNVFWGCPKLSIYCEAKSQPEGWHIQWNNDSRPVEWDYQKS